MAPSRASLACWELWGRPWLWAGLWGIVRHSPTFPRCPALPTQGSRWPPPWARQALGPPGCLELEPTFPAVATARLPMALPVAAAASVAGVPFQGLLQEHSCFLNQCRALCSSGPSLTFSGSLVSEAGEDKFVR